MARVSQAETARRDRWLVMQVVAALAVAGGIILLLLIGFRALAGGAENSTLLANDEEIMADVEAEGRE